MSLRYYCGAVLPSFDRLRAEEQISFPCARIQSANKDSLHVWLTLRYRSTPMYDL
jgi:hypothetical protein